MDDIEIPGEFHTVITKVYDSDGECIAISNAVVPGEYEPDEATKKYKKAMARLQELEPSLWPEKDNDQK